jgi:hypothetical protein
MIAAYHPEREMVHPIRKEERFSETASYGSRI